MGAPLPSQTMFKYLFQIAVTVEYGDDLQGPCSREIDDQVGIDREEFQCLVRQVLAPVSCLGCASEKNYPVSNNSFCPVRHMNATLGLDIAPNLG